MIYVVAKDYSEYYMWLVQVDYRSLEYTYVESVMTIKGAKGLIKGLFIGTCYDRDDIHDILHAINCIRIEHVMTIIEHDSIKHLTARSELPTTIASELRTKEANDKIVNNTWISAAFPYNKAWIDESDTINSSPLYEEKYPSHFKVTLSNSFKPQFVLVVAKLYKSFVSVEASPYVTETEYFFSKKQDAMDFANKYNTYACEYK